MERGRRAARNNDSKLFAFSERGIGSDDFCVTAFHVVDKDDVFSGDHPTQNGLLLQRSATNQKEAVCETSVCAIRGESGRGRYKDPVQETFKKLYAPNSGKRIKYGVFQETMSASEKNAYTDEEKTNLRRKAAEELTVIDKEERKRRGWFWFVFFSSNPFRRAVVSPSFLRVLRARAFHRAVL